MLHHGKNIQKLIYENPTTTYILTPHFIISEMESEAASAMMNEESSDLIKDLLKSFDLQEKEELFLDFLCDEPINLHYVYEFR